MTLFGGQILLGNAAFMSIGAYTSSVCTVKLGIPLMLLMGVAMSVPGLFDALVGFPALRLRGIYLAMVTIGLEVLKKQWKTKRIS